MLDKEGVQLHNLKITEDLGQGFREPFHLRRGEQNLGLIPAPKSITTNCGGSTCVC
jgi:hypothetical protein